MIHVDYSPVENCQSLELTYGEICVKCNKCGRFDKKKTMINSKEYK